MPGFMKPNRLYLNLCLRLLAGLLCGLALVAHAASPGSGVTYQGRLAEGGKPASGAFDLRFALFDAPGGGAQIGQTLVFPSVGVVDGAFTVVLDFGVGAFDGNARWLEVAVRHTGQGASLATLDPRQAITPAPYALYAMTPAGPPGPQGPAGAQGAKGNTGTTGPQGLAGPQGAAGPQGVTGAIGPAGPTGPIGPIGPKGLKWRGAWSAATAYAIDDAVSHNGASWTAKAASTGSAPAAGSTKWDLLADKGATGPQGASGPQGVTGAAGPAGPTGPVGPIGPKGLKWRGAWNASTAYAIDDAVSHSGASWLARVATTRSAPAIGSKNWDPLADKGATGATGPQGPPGSADAWSLTGNTGTNPNNQFLGTTDRTLFRIHAPGSILVDNDTPTLWFGNRTRQMLNLFADTTNSWFAYGIGIMPHRLYFRTGWDPPDGFTWFHGGRHSDATDYPGQDGRRMMVLTNRTLWVDGDVKATAFNATSDRNLKENFAAVDRREVLDKLSALPIHRWNFRDDAATLHLGPVAQDFHAAFGLGVDDKHIATVDADGVALAAIQGLNEKVERRSQESRARIEQLETENVELQQRLAELEALVRSLAPPPTGGGQ